MTIRTCSCCRRTSDQTEFYPSYRTQCKGCLKQKAAETRDQKVEYLRQWRRDHPNAFKQWRAHHLEERSRYYREWSAANKEHRSRSYAAWAKQNKHIVNAVIARRTAAKKRANVAWANDVVMKALYAQASMLSKSTGVPHAVDHIYPLQSDWVCGLHCEANLQILTKQENLRKGNRRGAVAA